MGKDGGISRRSTVDGWEVEKEARTRIQLCRTPIDHQQNHNTVNFPQVKHQLIFLMQRRPPGAEVDDQTLHHAKE